MNIWETLFQYGQLPFRALRRELIKASNRIYLNHGTDVHSERRPDFLIIGAMKSGTTSLHECLAQHPDIFMTYVKEPSFFLDDSPWLELYPSIGSAERLRKLMFKGYRQQRRVGESSTTYTEAPTLGEEAPANIYREAPDMQFIYIVRNPFARIMSHYLYCVDRGIYSEPMAEVLKRDTSLLERSLYHFQVARYLEYFDKNRFLILFFEEFVTNPNAELLKVCRFLGIPEEPVGRINAMQSNKTQVSSAVRDQNSRFDKSSYEALISPIQNDVRALSEFIGRDIGYWDLSAARWCNRD
jgi:hypothetical protein